MLTVQAGDVFEDWTVDETRLVDPGDGRWRPRRRWRSALTSGRAARTRRGSRASSAVRQVRVFKAGVADLRRAGRWDPATRGEVALRGHDGVLLRLRGTNDTPSRCAAGMEGRVHRALHHHRKWQIVPRFRSSPGGVQPRVQRGGDSTGPDWRWARPWFKRDRPGRLRFEARNQSTSREIRGVDGRDQQRSQFRSGWSWSTSSCCPRGRADFILVSCGGAHGGRGQDARGEQAQREKIVPTPAWGTRSCGRRAGGAGGSKALVFDQGRITMPISWRTWRTCACASTSRREQVLRRVLRVQQRRGRRRGVREDRAGHRHERQLPHAGACRAREEHVMMCIAQ